MRFCSERETSFLVPKKWHPSTDPVVEKDQHDPHCCWFLIGVTAPWVAQFHVAGTPERAEMVERKFLRVVELTWVPR